jgi:hypothetical protein
MNWILGVLGVLVGMLLFELGSILARKLKPKSATIQGLLLATPFGLFCVAVSLIKNKLVRHYSRLISRQPNIHRICSHTKEGIKMARFKATVKMKKPWTTAFPTQPTVNNVLEALADEILSGKIDDLFQITVEKVKNTSSIHEEKASRLI